MVRRRLQEFRTRGDANRTDRALRDIHDGFRSLEDAVGAVESDVAGRGVPSGAAMLWATGTPPEGWLVCDGSLASRTDFAELFAVIGTTFGSGDGVTTFALPNMTDRLPRGGGTIGQTGGSQTHNHSISGSGSRNVDSGTAEKASPSHSHGGATGSKDSWPPFLRWVWIIKT